MPEGGILAAQYRREKAERDLATAWRQLGCGGGRSQLSDSGSSWQVEGGGDA